MLNPPPPETSIGGTSGRMYVTSKLGVAFSSCRCFVSKNRISEYRVFSKNVAAAAIVASLTDCTVIPDVPYLSRFTAGSSGVTPVEDLYLNKYFQNRAAAGSAFGCSQENFALSGYTPSGPTLTPSTGEGVGSL